MHGRLDQCRQKPKRANDAQSTFLMSIDAVAATPEQILEFLRHLPKAAAFIVHREPCGRHKEIIAALVAGGATYCERAGAEEPIRSGYVYLVDEDMSFSRRGGKLVIYRAKEVRVFNENLDERTSNPPLTVRQQEVLDMVVAGEASKRIALYLRISQRTVDNHRAAIMRRLGARSLAELVRISVTG